MLAGRVTDVTVRYRLCPGVPVLIPTGAQGSAEEPVDLPYGLGLPPGDQPGDESRQFGEADVRKTRAVDSEEDRSLFKAAGAASVVVDGASAPIWIMPLKEPLWCRFGK